MFTACLVQKKMQTVRNSKGLTVVIMDDNKKEMPKLSDELYRGDAWFDPLYQVQVTKRNKSAWVDRTEQDRFDHIVNTAFAIKSDHSSLIQVADALCYVYRRHLELRACEEAWRGEKAYYGGLFSILEPSRDKLGRCPSEGAIRFFQQAKHVGWSL